MGHIALAAGDLAAAEEWLLEGISGCEVVGMPYLADVIRGELTQVHLLAGDLARARESALSREGDLTMIDAWIEVSEGRGHSVGVRLLDDIAACVGAGDRYSAAMLLQSLIELDLPLPPVAIADRLVEGVDSPLLLRLAEHVRAGAGGDPAALLEVAARWRDEGQTRLEAAALAGASRLLRAAGEGRAASAAQARAEEAARAGGLSTPVLRFARASEPLTPREREIASMAAAGAASKEIAALLHLSVRTVDNHLQRIYGKLGVTGRAELARVGLDQGT